MKTCFIWANALFLIAASSQVQATTLYSIGEPTAKEQLYVELINRARVNPTAEGIRLDSYNDTSLYSDIASAYSFFSVNLAMMKSEFVTGSAAGLPTLNVVPPLSISSQLTDAARAHSQDQIDNDFQSHTSSSGSTAGQRITASGYTWSALGENTYANARRVIHGHAGFNVDWGTGSGGSSGGMQISSAGVRGHRSTIHSPNFREIGVGNLTSAETTIPAGNTVAKGPEVVTQDFSIQPGSSPFITGVAYYDLNGNNFYDLGEGLGGVPVTVSGSSYHAVTSASGGYSVPVSGNGSYLVTFSPANGIPSSVTRSVANLENIKQDLILSYPAPSITGPSCVSARDTNSYCISDVPGATGYTWLWGALDATPNAENADVGTAGYSSYTTGTYSLVQNSVAVSGNAFRLCGYSGGGFDDQTLTLERTLYPGAAGSISFRSRLTWQTTGQHAKVQISEDGGVNWTDTSFDQAGPSSAGESSFTTRAVSLSASAGKAIKIRFLLDYQSGGLFNVDPLTFTSGWYIDNITFSDVEEMLSPTEVSFTGGNKFTFSSNATGTYRLISRADLMGGALPYGDFMDVEVLNTDFTSWLNSNPSVTGGNAGDADQDGLSNLFEYAFSSTAPSTTLTGGSISLSATRPSYPHADLDYVIQERADLSSGIWTTAKTFNSVEPLTYSIPAGSAKKFYRWKVSLNVQ